MTGRRTGGAAPVEEPLCFDGDGTLVTAPGVDINRAPGCSYTSAETYYCSGFYPVDPAIVPFLCDGTSLIDEALYPNCDGSNNDHTYDPIDPEIPCNGIDDDGDGDIDENSVTSDEYTWTHAGGGGNAAAGAFTALEMTYNPAMEMFSFSGTITYPDPWWQTNIFEFAVNDGPNPSGQGELAMLYFDYSGADPIITVYAYNGSSMYTSHIKGTSNNGDAPDRIASTLLDDSFVTSLTANKSGTALTFDVTLDVAAINSHTPLYWNAAGWKGLQFDDLFGLWLHPIANGNTSYWNGYVDSLSWGSRGWLDLVNRPTVATPVCKEI